LKAFPKDVTPQTMTTRHVGVENELRLICNEDTIRTEISKSGLLDSIGHDGGGREFRTTPISTRSLKQVRGFRHLSEYYDGINRHTEVLQTGGTHIHISILETDHPNMESNATAMAIAFHSQFQKISGRQSNWASRLQKQTIQQVRQMILERSVLGHRVYRMKGYMLNPTLHQTLEFRGPKGSNNKEEILAWIEFIENVVKVANRESIEGITFKRLLRTKRIAAYVDALPKTRKLTNAELNQKFNGAALII
jgi:hypothetical protein